MSSFKGIKVIFQGFVRWFTVPQTAPDMNRTNFLNVQIDAVGVGLASTAAPFLPVFLTRLGASTLAISMLTFMPAMTGLVLAIPLGQFLQSRKNIVPWFSMARLAVLSGYTLTGLITLFVPMNIAVYAILAIWALVTIPQTLVNITFSVVMNGVAGPAGRFELMTHRWSVMGFTNAITALMAGQILDTKSLPFPINYQVVFIALSVGGLISYYFSSRLVLPDHIQPPKVKTISVRESINQYIQLIAREKPFVSFVSKRFVFLTGAALAAPLLPIYYVRELEASDSWIALINIAANTTVILGYFFWTRQSRRRGSQLVLIATTLGGSFYPILVGITHQVWPIVLFSAINGIFNAGLNLVLFDELMKRVPEDYSATFVAAAQALQYMSSIVAPFLATWLSDTVGFAPALIFAGLVSLAGFALFLNEMLTGSAKAAQKLLAK